MSATSTPAQPEGSEPAPAPAVSLVAGGLHRRLAERAGLRRPWQRALAFVLVAWAPLLVLAVAGAVGGGGALAGGADLRFFLADLPAHVRFLLAVPILVMAERSVEARVRLVAGQFVATGLVPPGARGGFDEAVAELRRWRDSGLAEAVVVAVAFLAALAWFRNEVADGAGGWYARSGPDGLRFLPAGWWYAVVSIPLYQAILYRWCYLSILWFRFLWRVSRLPLQLVPAHPDRCGGLGFVAQGSSCFAPVVAAATAVISAVEGHRILAGVETFDGLKWGILAVGVAIPALFLVPLVFFVPALLEVRRRGQVELGALASQVARAFHARWTAGGEAGGAILDRNDASSLADLATAVDLARRTQVVPGDRTTVLILLAASLIPFAPLLLTRYSIWTLLDMLAKVVR